MPTIQFIHPRKLLYVGILLFSFFYLNANFSFAAPNSEIAPKQKRPRIALVLEGGGAKGFAHVGVIKYLQQQRVPIDFVAGTSMGAIVGAAYSSGRTVEEMEYFIKNTNWDDLFNEGVKRQERNYRQKAGKDKELFGDTKFGIKDGSLIIPRALVQGQNVEPLFQELFGKVPTTVSFDDLPVPFRAVAADIETGDAVILDHGNLARAARASMSVPGFFTPVELDGKLLVDGGVCDNLPVDVALSMEPDVIIAVVIKDKFKTRDQLGDPIAISGQILDILLEKTTQSRIKMLRPTDIIIEIDLRNLGATSFGNAQEIMSIGEEQAHKAESLLKPLSISEDEYASYLASRTNSTEYEPIIDYVRVEEQGWRAERNIAKMVNVEIGQPLDRKDLEKHIELIYQSGEYKKVGYEIEQSGTQHGVVIKAEQKEWLQTYLRFGFSLEDDFQGDGTYRLATDLRFNGLNSYGAYADLQGEIGESPQLFGEFYQPITRGGLLFVAPEATLSRTSIPIRQGNDIVAEYTRDSENLGLKGGISMVSFGEVSTGWYWGDGDLKRRIGDPSLNDISYHVGEIRTKFTIDKLNDPDFPTIGEFFKVMVTNARDGLGSSSDFDQIVAQVSKPITYGATTLLLNAELGQSSNDLSPERSYSLGGFFDISGFEQNSLVASDYYVGRLALYRRISEGGSALFPFGGYVGGTVEYSSLRSDIAAITDMPSIVSGSLFIGANTPILPVYFGFGLADQSEHSFYLTIGRLAGRRR